ncbi:DUF4058 family protein [Chloroflexi bacterium TSY]|nr:DUF4058 family protein [Chloroflexi bacterium TSY]
MNPVRSIRNQYLGINAHLHSLWQAEGGWSEFHTSHIIHLANALKAVLLPMGYTTAIEPSLQIRRLDHSRRTQYPESDITIYDPVPSRRTPSSVLSESMTTGEIVLPLKETLLTNPLSEKDYQAIKIYELSQSRPNRGEPIVWIELLSPSNKPGGRDADGYINKRLTIVENGIVFVELDYLHESSSTLSSLPDYRTRKNRKADKGSHPYRILIVDPRPEIQDGIVRVNQFDVDESIPVLLLPLRDQDVLQCDFGLPYHKTIEEGLFTIEAVDYREYPHHFERYAPADQLAIARRMLSTLNASAANDDLEAGPFAVSVDPNFRFRERIWAN